MTLSGSPGETSRAAARSRVIDLSGGAQLPMPPSTQNASPKSHFHVSQRPEVSSGHVPRLCKTVTRARPGTNDLARLYIPTVRPRPVEHPGQAGYGVAHRSAALTRLEVPAVEVQVHTRLHQVDLPPVLDLHTFDQGGAAPVIQARTEIAAGTVPIEEDGVAEFQRREQGIDAGARASCSV